MRKREREAKPEVYYEVVGVNFPEPIESIDALNQALMRTGISDSCPLIIKIYKLINDAYHFAELPVTFNVLANLKEKIEAALNSISPTPRLFQQKSFTLKKGLISAGKLEPSGTVKSDNGVKFVILDSQCCDFLSQPILSLGETTFKTEEREGIILNPESKTLQSIYDSITSNLARGDNLFQSLDILLSTLVGLFSLSKQEHLDVVVREHATDKISLKENKKTCNLVLLDYFLLAKTGVCRHHSLMACYIIHRLIKENGLAAEKVHQVRGHVPRGSHSWVMIKGKNDQWIHFDSQWKILKKINVEGYSFLCGKYSKEAIDGALEKVGAKGKKIESECSGTLSL